MEVDGNISAENLTVTNINAEKINVDSLCLSCITEKTVGESVVIDKPLLKNIHGVGRIYLDNFVKIDTNDTPIELFGNAWATSFESIGNGPSLLLPSPIESESPVLFRAASPSDYNNSCLNSGLLLVEVHVSLGFQALYETSVNTIALSLKKSGTVVSNVLKTIHTYNITRDNISLQNSVLLNPYDNLTLEITKFSDDNSGSVGIQSGSENSWATFKVLGFVDNLQ